MSSRIGFLHSRLFLGLGLAFILAISAACASSTAEGENEPEMDGGMSEDMDHGDAEHDEEHAHDEGAEVIRVPNQGATISLVAPADGATFKSGEEVVVEIEVENIDLGDSGNHWHIYVDGSSWGMIMGGNTDEVLRGLESGTHEIAVYLSIETHEELEEGDSVTITIEE
jgi:hypothetical protein